MLSREYLEKIIQKPIKIPVVEQGKIDSFVDHYVNELFNEIKVNESESEAFSKDIVHVYQTNITKIIRTLRQAKLFISSLRTTLPVIKSEVNLYDCFILEVIKVFYPRVFDDIWRNPQFYIPLGWSKRSVYYFPDRFNSDDKNKYDRVKKHIESIIINEPQKDSIKELLQAVFLVEVNNAFSSYATGYDGVANSYRANKRITHPDVFIKYFLQDIPVGELSDAYIDSTLEKINNTESSKRKEEIHGLVVELQKKEMLVEYFKKLITFIENIPADSALDIIKYIYENSQLFSKKDAGSFWNSEFDKAETLMIWLINDKIDKTQIKNLIQDIVLKTPSFAFAVRVIQACKSERGGHLFNVYDSVKPVESLQDILSARLKIYFIDEDRDLFDELPDAREWPYVLYQWATNWESFTEANAKVVNDYIVNIVKNDQIKFIKLISGMRERTFSDTLVFSFKNFGRIYDISALKTIASEFLNDKSIKTEDAELLKQFIATKTGKDGGFE